MPRLQKLQLVLTSPISSQRMLITMLTNVGDRTTGLLPAPPDAWR
jgi:hypothetical protein